MQISIFDLIYLFYIAITESLFVQISTIIIFYFAAYYVRHPRHNWYYDDYIKPPEESMPRYNLNHEDVNIITQALSKASMNAHSIQEHTRITRLKTRLLNKIVSPSSAPSNDPVWDFYQGKP